MTEKINVVITDDAVRNLKAALYDLITAHDCKDLTLEKALNLLVPRYLSKADLTYELKVLLFSEKVSISSATEKKAEQTTLQDLLLPEDKKQKEENLEDYHYVKIGSKILRSTAGMDILRIIMTEAVNQTRRHGVLSEFIDKVNAAIKTPKSNRRLMAITPNDLYYNKEFPEGEYPPFDKIGKLVYTHSCRTSGYSLHKQREYCRVMVKVLNELLRNVVREQAPFIGFEFKGLD